MSTFTHFNCNLGHETTSGALTWASYVLATRPEIQNKLRDEVVKALGTVGVPTYADIEKLHYMKNFLQEVARVYSPGKPSMIIPTTDISNDSS